MYNTIIYLVGFLCLVGHSDQRSTPTDDSYVAAVIEYQVLSDINTNLNNYIRLIKEAADQDADIVVFPEMTLGSRRVPVPIHDALKDHPIPAENPGIYDEVLVKISTAAKENAVYVVINLQEVMDCENVTGEYCPEKKEYLFNTNVVFDRAGAVIDRYRKINLFGEFTRTPALTPDLGVFTTDFGVTFGHFICFDLMFQVPAVQIVQKNNLTDIIFTTMWFSEMPYLTAVEIQQAYAYAMNVNFLASGANNVRVGSAGSGIFSGKAGALVSIMPGVPTTKVMVARVPKVPGQVTGTYPGPIDDDVNHDNLVLKADPSLPSHTSRLLVPGYQDFILSEDGVVCRFKVNLKQTENTLYRYRAGVFSGVRTFDNVASGGARLCSIYACTGAEVDTCGKRFEQYQPKSVATFDELSIYATLQTPQTVESLQAHDIVYYPVSLKPSILPLNSNDFALEIQTMLGTVDLYNYTLLNNNVGLYSFGIYGRVFADDGKEPTPPIIEEEREETTPALVTTEPTPEPVPDSSVTICLSLILAVLSLTLVLMEITPC
ncbi:vanin-like protein 1 isoform X1 [Leptidea sinapis]|uniref:vanin-like protein 1 isoform X1 n=1 Tax=Leptidea sinapis TaxID=189913 RepID=UPI002128FEA2|nr:vanin-like protein 1 isoform X1 [Leptidea sinapis]